MLMPIEFDCYLKHVDHETKFSHCWRISDCIQLGSRAKFRHEWPADIAEENTDKFTLTVNFVVRFLTIFFFFIFEILKIQ